MGSNAMVRAYRIAMVTQAGSFASLRMTVLAE